MRFTAVLTGLMSVVAWSEISAQADAPPAPRPWNSEAPAPAAPTAQANGSRLKVVGDAPSDAANAKAAGKFVVSPGLRQNPTGWSMGVFAGANLFQSAEGGTVITQELLPGPILADVERGFDDESAVGAAVGLKLRYTWPFQDEPIDQFRDEVAGGIRLSGALELESFYNGGKIIANSNTTTAETDLHTAGLMANFLLVGEFGKFRPYIGPGIGGALVFATDYQSPNTTQEDDETVTFAYQGIIGTDYFINPEWSIFGEYKYLVYQDLGLFSGNAQINADRLENHLLVFGLRKHF